MHVRVTKKDIRMTVERISGRSIYRTANLKTPSQYRMSIHWHGGYRNAQFDDVDPAVWQECNRRRDKLMHVLETMYPQLKGNISYTYHIGIGIYLILRVNNEVLVDRRMNGIDINAGPAIMALQARSKLMDRKELLKKILEHLGEAMYLLETLCQEAGVMDEDFNKI